MSFFGPNPFGIHHRGRSFSAMYRELLERLAGYAPHHRPIILTGSGTAGIEFLIDSSPQRARVWQPDHPFASRIASSLKARKDSVWTIDPTDIWAVQYDPCLCAAIDPTQLQREAGRGRLLIDAVSSWPYYSVPDNTACFVTVSSKQLGAAPVLSFVFCTEEFILQSPSSELRNLYGRAYDLAPSGIKLKDNPETPNTPAIPLMAHALKKLRRFDLQSFRKTIDDRRSALEAFPFVTGEGPVATLNRSLSSRLGFEEFYFKNDEAKLFLWSGTDNEFQKLITILEGISDVI